MGAQCQSMRDGRRTFLANCVEVRSFYTDKTRYGPSGITSHYIMTGHAGLVPCEVIEEEGEQEAA